MKLNKYKDITSTNIWKYEDWDEQNIHKLLGNLSWDAAERAFVTNPEFRRNISARSSFPVFLNSPSMVKILRGSVVTDPDEPVELYQNIYPVIVVAPIGAITADAIIAASKGISEEYLGEYLKRAAKNPGFAARNTSFKKVYWSSEQQDRFYRELVASTGIPEESEHYIKGIESTLSMMTAGSWDERILHLFFALNAFLGHTEEETVTFGEYLKKNSSQIDAEFAAFNGADNAHTKELVEAWGSYRSVIYPVGNNVTKVKTTLGALTRSHIVKMNSLVVHGKEYYNVKVSNQVSLIESLAQNSLLDGEPSFGKGVAGDMLAEVYDRCQRESGITMLLFGHMKDMIAKYTTYHANKDVQSSAIIRFLHDRAESLTIREVSGILFAATNPQGLTTNGTENGARFIVHQLLMNSRDQQAAFDFILSTIYDYDGPLPTEKMWMSLIESDQENHEFDLSPTLAFTVSETSASKTAHRNSVDSFRERLQWFSARGKD